MVFFDLPARSSSLGVVLDSTSRREAKRGQSTNRKGEMSRASHYKAKNSKRNLDVTFVKYILSLFGQTRFYLDKHVSIWTDKLCGPSDVVSKRLSFVLIPYYPFFSTKATHLRSDRV